MLIAISKNHQHKSEVQSWRKYLSPLKTANSTTEIRVTTPQAMATTLWQRKHLMHWVFAKIADGARKQEKNENGA